MISVLERVENKTKNVESRERVVLGWKGDKAVAIPRRVLNASLDFTGPGCRKTLQVSERAVPGSESWGRESFVSSLPPGATRMEFLKGKRLRFHHFYKGLIP